MKVSIIIPAAGKGKRMGHSFNKQYLRLKERPILYHTLAVFQGMEDVLELIVVIPKEEFEICREQVLRPAAFLDVKLVAGGKERQDSVFNALKAVDKRAELVCIHDGARPLVKKEHVIKVLREAQNHGASCLGVPVKDTIKTVDALGNIINTPEREKLWIAQTPQVFHKNIIMTAYEKAKDEKLTATDDCSLVESSGNPVRMVAGDYTNIKITTPDDLTLAASFLGEDA